MLKLLKIAVLIAILVASYVQTTGKQAEVNFSEKVTQASDSDLLFADVPYACSLSGKGCVKSN